MGMGKFTAPPPIENPQTTILAAISKPLGIRLENVLLKNLVF